MKNIISNSYSGHFDGIFGRVAMGWALCIDIPEEPVEIEFFIDNRLIASDIANIFRQDLVDAGIGNGAHGFKCLLPVEVFDGNSYQIQARIKGTNSKFAGSPQQVNQRLASLHDAFSPSALSASKPMTDFQVAMLHGLTTVCETLKEQNRAFDSLLRNTRSEQSIALSQDAVTHAPATAFDDDFRRTVASHSDVLIFSIIDWQFRIQRPQHLAENFVKLGCRVVYLSVHLDAHTGMTEPYFIKSKPSKDIFEVVLRCTPPVPSIYAGIKDANQLRELCLAVDHMVSALGIHAPLCIVQYPTWTPIAQSLAGARVVFDCMDHLAGFSTASPEVIALEHDLIRTADTVITTSSYLQGAITKTRHAPIVRNAAEIDYFSTRPLSVIDYKVNGPVIGYYGAISEWFDSELVRKVALKNPSWTVVLIGATDGADLKPLEGVPNIVMLGELNYRELTSHLYAFDCCIIPFKLTELIKATDPVKVYEYFSAGKPVVATQMPELKQVPRELITLADNSDRFIAGIAAALKEKPANQAKRQLWAFQNSWFKRSRDFLQHVADDIPKVSVVVLSFNGLELTKACLQSLTTLSQYPKLEIICVDNNSSDGTPEYLTEWSKGRKNVKIILSEINTGFAAGNNLGINAATGDYTILLNNDTFVTEGWVQDLIRPMEADRTIGATGPVTNLIGNEQKISIHYMNMEEMAQRARKFTIERKRDVYITKNLAFFCVAIAKHALAKVGLLDESFGLGFFEDDDYCQRLTQAGYKLAIVDGAFVHHHLSGSFNKEPEKKRELMRINKEKFEKKWGPWTSHSYRNQVGFGD